jgi:hypothetical protein
MRNVIGNGAVALAASAVLGMASISSANQISVNLGIQGSGNTVTTTAGVSPQTSNWNNELTSSSSTGQTFSNLVDNTGTLVTTTLSFTAAGTSANAAVGTRPWMGTGDTALFTSYAYISAGGTPSTPLTVSLNNVDAPYQSSGYYVDLFVDDFGTNGGLPWEVTGGGTSPLWFTAGPTPGSGYTDGASTSSGSAGATNYLQYYETASSDTFTFVAANTIGLTAGDLTVFGVQIVQAPEPASLGLLALSSLGLLARHRRKAAL